MRKRQFGIVRHHAAEVHEVYVDGARPVANCAPPPEGVFHFMHPLGELPRRKRCLEHRDLVHELHGGEFGWNVNRLCLDSAARCDKLSLRKRGKRIDGAGKVLHARLDVRPKRDNRPDSPLLNLHAHSIPKIRRGGAKDAFWYHAPSRKATANQTRHFRRESTKKLGNQLSSTRL